MELLEAILVPLVNGLLGVVIGKLVSPELGGVTLFGVLAASATDNRPKVSNQAGIS